MNLTAALVSIALLGLCFSPTRWMGVSATALLVFYKPWLAIVVLGLVLVFFYLLKLRK